MEVSRYRPLTLAWASLLTSLLCLAVAVGIDTSGWVDAVVGYAIAGGVACLLDRFVPRSSLSGNGRLFRESKRGPYRKPDLYVEDPAFAPLDAW